MTRSKAYVLVLVFLLGWCFPAHAEKRVALVIGNSAYEHAPELKNPKNDAAAMSAVLQTLGFEVVTGTDLSHVDFAQTVSQFRKKLKGADVGLFFYAGHGLQVHGQNYLAPIDAELDDETSLNFEAVPLHVILRLMERSTKTNLVFLDACRDNPLARNLARSMGTRSTAIGRGLAREETGLGTMISFATQPGNVALDGDGKNSPFAAGMLKHIETPGMDVALVMRRVREDVIKETSGSQVPWSNSSLTGSFIFRDRPTEEAKPAPKPVAKTPGVDALAIELAFWQAAKDEGTRQAYEAYLSKYPKGNFAPLATLRLDAVARSQEAAAKQKAELQAAQKKQQVAEKAKRTAEAEERKRELAALEKKQAEERERLAKERDDLAKRLKAIEETVKARAEAEKQDEQKLAALQPAEQAQQADTRPTPVLDARTMALVLQNELRRVGCDPGKVDGKWGAKGTGALTRFNKHAKLKLPTATPTMEAVEAVKGTGDRVCPLTCGPQYNQKDGQCVKKTCRAGQRLNSRGQCIKIAVKAPSNTPRPNSATKKRKKRECYNEFVGPEVCF